MGTLKGCLAVVKDFTAEDFDALEAKAQEYAKGKTLTNDHFVKAARDMVATLKSDAKLIRDSMEPETTEETNATAPENTGEKAAASKAEEAAPKVESDLTANATAAENPEETRATLKRRLDRLINGAVFLESKDEARILDAIASGDFDTARAAMAEIEGAMRKGFYRTTDPVTVTNAISDADLTKIVSDVEAALGGESGITIMDSVSQWDPKQKAGTRSGVMTEGRVILFRDGIASGVDGLKTVFHELFHKGLRNLVPEAEYTDFMNRLYNQSAEIRQLADNWLKDANNKADVADFSERGQRAVAVEEVLAGMAENTKLKPSMARQLGNWFASVADRLGLKKLAQWLRTAGTTPLQQFINDAIKASVQGKSAWDGDTRYRTVTAKEATAAATSIVSKLRYDALGSLKRGVLRMSFLRDLAERFGKSIEGVQAYTDAVFRMSAAEAKIQELGEKVQIAWNKLPRKGKENVANLMADVTELDATVDGSNDHLSKEDQLKARVLKDRFEKMSADEKAAYILSRNTLAQLWKDRGDQIAATTRAVYQPLIDQANEAGQKDKADSLTRAMNSQLRENNEVLASIKGDYFPMMRFGDYLVVKKSPEFEAVRAKMEKAYADLDALMAKFDKKTVDERKAIKQANKKLKDMGSDVELEEFTPEERAQIREARNLYRTLKKQLDEMKSSEKDYAVNAFESRSEAEAHKGQFGGEVTLKAEHESSVNPMTKAFLDKIGESLQVTLGGEGNVQAVRDAKRAMYEIFLTNLPDRSAMKRQAKRRGVAGFDRDMQRSIAASILRDSFFLSRLEHSDSVNEALIQAERSARESGKVENQEVVRELADRHAMSYKFVDTPIQDFLTQLAYVWRLGVSPAYLLTNLMQPGLVTAPMLWARHGGASRAAFATAFGDTFDLVNKSLNAKGSIEGKLSQIDFSFLKDEDERKMLNQMLEANLLNVTLVQELARTADGKGVSRITSWLAKPSHYVEQINRIASALAAYRLEKAKSGQADAVKYAQRVLADTHFDYSAENAPYYMKPGAFAGNKLIFQFKKYQAGMISLLVKNVARWAKGETAEVRREAKRQLMGMLVTHGAIGGAIGIPAAGTAAFLVNLVVNAFGDDDGEKWDTEVWLRNWANDTFGKEVGDVLAKGLPTLLDMDFSQRVGLGDILNPMPTARTDGKEGRELWLEILAAGMGPAIGGLGGQAADAAMHLANGNIFRATESLMPKFIADGMKAARFADEGVTTRSGTTALDPAEISAWDLVQQASGLVPQNISDRYEARAAVENTKRSFNDTASRYKNDWLKARKDGDTEAMNELWTEIREKVNPARQRNGLKPITQSELLKFAQQRARQESSYAKYGANVGKNAELAQVGRFAQEQ